jgi:hypothetical protein
MAGRGPYRNVRNPTTTVLRTHAVTVVVFWSVSDIGQIKGHRSEARAEDIVRPRPSMGWGQSVRPTALVIRA